MIDTHQVNESDTNRWNFFLQNSLNNDVHTVSAADIIFRQMQPDMKSDRNLL